MATRSSKTTTDHTKIRRWTEARGGCPAAVKTTGGKGDPGIIRIDFPGYSGRTSLRTISWDEFFEKFDESGLALVYQEKTPGGALSRFNKLVSQETAKARSRGTPARARKTSSVRAPAAAMSAKSSRSKSKKATAKKATARRKTAAKKASRR
jgi:hypothetical protein